MLVTGTQAMVNYSVKTFTTVQVNDADAGRQLEAELSKWLQAVGPTEDAYPIKGCKAVIAPSAQFIVSSEIYC